MRRTLFAALIALAIVPQAVAAPTFLKSVAEAQAQAKKKNQMIFVDLFAEWCGWCHKFDREVAPSAAFQKETANMVLLRLDTEDRAEGTKIAIRYQATSLPMFLILDSDMTLAGAIKGYFPAEQFARVLADTKARYAEFEKKLEREPAIAKDYKARLDLARELVQRQAYEKSAVRLQKLITEKGVPADVRNDAHLQLALSQYLEGKYDDALKTAAALGKSVKSGEAAERARLLITDVYMARGNNDAAANELRKFKTAFPGSRYMVNVDRLLQQLEQK